MRKVYVMLGLSVVVWVVAFVVNFDASGKGAHRAPATEGAEIPLPAVDAASVRAIEIRDAENSVKIARAGDNWVLPDKFGAPAMGQRANDLLKALDGLEKAVRVARSAGSAKGQVYGLEPAVAKRVRLLGDEGKVLADLWVGKPDMGGERSVQLAGNFVRMEGNDAVYSHKNRLQHLVLPQLSMWLEARLFALEPKELEEAIGKAEKVVVEFDDVAMTPETKPADPAAPPPARVRVVMEGRYPESQPAVPDASVGPTPTSAAKPPKPQRDWTILEPADAGVKPFTPFVDQMVRGLIYSRADDVVGTDPTLAEYGFARPFVELEIRFEDGTTRRMRVGNRAPAPSEPSRRSGTFRFAHVDGVSRVFLLNEFALNAFRKKPDELKQPDSGQRGAPGGVSPIELPKDAPDSRR